MRRFTTPQFWVAVLLVTTVGIFNGCGGYPQVSKRAYEIDQALFSACSRRDAAAVSRIVNLIEQSLAQEQIRSDEADWLKSIASIANEGDWESALQESRRMMHDQVEW